ncbi:hypothetical protein SEA_GODPHATHER_30 [Mycobacterium phage GodPhather]|uniref:30S ribosomal protein S27ae n=1 Tax=Mycobacterium phage Jeon TaxID=2108123 RepID=A0A2P1JRK9_9CAUD|nr:hypothetical protein PQB70_gp29 [Mycobacterium phage Jeon]AVO21732.1 hypothetical protein SEA_JEON_29 [Mycobacterium phage Jeon]QBP31147.1 hypothetical protein SEA_ARGIE_30 [Mycobacterium phage Argie]QBP32603.1 hypothetical protein SEA_GODPHATHER_30 [Mycobacterium phage GodPhather]
MGMEMRRESMVPPDSGRVLRPGRDCPNCGTGLVVVDGWRECVCGHRERDL